MTGMFDALKQKDPYTLHASAKFEGFYSKYLLPSGAFFIIVICRIPRARNYANAVTLTYIPADNGPIWQREIEAASMPGKEHPKTERFALLANDSTGHALARLDASPFFAGLTLSMPDATFSTTPASDKPYTPWSSQTRSPESWLGWLPLPLHWHVHSLAAPCHFSLHLPEDASLPNIDTSGSAVAHHEKNWANSFPSAHMWVQARHGGRGICLAGGRILGMDAFLVGYRNEARGLEVDFRPPFALRVAGLGPFLRTRIDWQGRTFELSVSDVHWKLDVKAVAPMGSFFALSSPFPDGHRKNWLAQSMKAIVTVALYRRRNFWGWDLECTDQFEHSSLEFGGDYYPMRGTAQTRN